MRPGLVAALSLEFPDWIRLTHGLNLLFLSLLLRSGIEILGAFPKLYWNDHCTPGTEWLRLSRKGTAQDLPKTSLEEGVSIAPWLALPGRKNLGLGRHWHFLAVVGWIATGTAYVGLLVVTAEWRRLVPTSWSVVPDAWDELATYLSFELPAEEAAYGALQQLSYFSVVFLLAPLAIASGAAMSPAIDAAHPWYARVFGGKQGARSIHFGCLVAFVLFTLVHTAMVALHGLPEGLGRVVLGSPDASATRALALGALALAAIVAIHVGATLWSLRAPRSASAVLVAPVELLQRALSRIFRPRGGDVGGGVSPVFRANGLPPAGEAYAQLAASAFRDYRLRVGGLVGRELLLSLDDLRALSPESQLTLHHCIQGWSAVALWTGVPLATLLDSCDVEPGARFVVVHAFDDKAQTAVEDEPAEGVFYETISLGLARRPSTILAYAMNGSPLDVAHGAPLRLRVEGQLGFKMVKWIREIELVDDYRGIGLGRGGWREDRVHFGPTAAI